MNTQLKTALHQEHLNLSAKMVDFNGWQLPLYYSSILKEHLNVRRELGLFDVSHMGKISITGAEAENFLQLITTNNVKKLNVNKCQYTLILNESGGILDDLTLLKVADQSFYLIVNAATLQQDLAHLMAKATDYQVTIEDMSNKFSLLALQGKQAQALLQELVRDDITKIVYYGNKVVASEFGTLLISRLGYTGEDGFEIMVENQHAALLWQSLLKKGQLFKLLPCGLGARDTLRLEAGYLLYGKDMTSSNTPHTVGLGWITKMDKIDFWGKKSLTQTAAPAKKLFGLLALAAGIPRSGYEVYDSTGKIFLGTITSGNISPVLNQGIALAHLDAKRAQLDDILLIKTRTQFIKAKAVKPPFIKITKPLLAKN